MQLRSLLADCQYTLLSGDLSVDVTALVYDSRKVTDKALFVCLVGTKTDAHTYIPEVVQKGATALLVERDIDPINGVTIVKVENARHALSLASAAWFDYPAKKLTMIGLTGTKGKTSVSYMLKAIFDEANISCGIIGTIGAWIQNDILSIPNTTPESYTTQELLAKMVDAGCTHCVMEVSSQGLKMDRVAGIQYDIGVFTNFSADHIGPNEHESMEEYLYCKSLLFQQCKIGILNADDASFSGVLKNHTCEVRTFGQAKDADIRLCSYELTKEKGQLGLRFETEGACKTQISLPIPGRFNIYNALSALSVAVCLHIPESTIQKALLNVHVKGRTEVVPVRGDYTVMIDYAHNEVSVESLMATVKEYEPSHIICVFGGGGNRAKMRRYVMGEICGKLADLCIITADNPRDEDIASINADIRVGLEKSHANYIEIEDRKEGIWHAMDIAKPGDLILLIGKGHEEYQEIRGKKYHYSDRESVESYPR